MLEFKAYFCGNHVYIDEQAYRCNETLTACLSLPEPELNDCLVSLWQLVPGAQLHGVSTPRLRAFLDCMQSAQKLFFQIGRMVSHLPIFLNSSLGLSLTEACLPSLLGRLCHDGGAGVQMVDDSFSFSDFYFLRIASTLSRLSGTEAEEEIASLNRGVAELFERYICLAGDLLQARRAYSALLDGYIHEKRAFLSGEDLADCFARYFRDSSALGPYDRLPAFCQVKLSYEPFTGADGHGQFAMSCIFNRLRDFLYTDFFRGLELSHLPRRCDNCGRYFLLSGGKYSNYCEAPLPDEPQKTCRSIGARKRYGSKCKNDPVWLTYNRAYKTHYARYMKGKMTAGEFERWSRYAVSLRDQAAEGTLGAEQYERLIKE